MGRGAGPGCMEATGQKHQPQIKGTIVGRGAGPGCMEATGQKHQPQIKDYRGKRCRSGLHGGNWSETSTPDKRDYRCRSGLHGGNWSETSTPDKRETIVGRGAGPGCMEATGQKHQPQIKVFADEEE